MAQHPKRLNLAYNMLTETILCTCHQDDLLAPDSLYTSINRVIETGTDIVLPDMQRYYENSTTNF